MRNLLPEDKKSIVNREYILRVIIVSLWLLFFVLVICVGLIVSSYLVVQSKAAALHSRDNLIKQTIVIKEKDVSMDELEEAKDHLNHLGKAVERSSLRNLISSIIEARPEGLKLKSFDYTSGKEMKQEDKNEDIKGQNTVKSKIQINGIASDRDTLIYFSKTLKKIDKIDDVDLPVSQFAQSKDIPFSMTAEGEF